MYLVINVSLSLALLDKALSLVLVVSVGVLNQCLVYTVTLSWLFSRSAVTEKSPLAIKKNASRKEDSACPPSVVFGAVSACDQ